MTRFQKEEEVVLSLRSRFQRNNPPWRGRPSAPRPSASIASATAISPHQVVPEIRGDARFSQYRQSHTSSCFYTPVHSVPQEPPPRVQPFMPVDRGLSTQVPRSDFFTTTAPAARYDRRESSPFEPHSRRDSYQQQQQAGRDWAF